MTPLQHASLRWLDRGLQLPDRTEISQLVQYFGELGLAIVQLVGAAFLIISAACLLMCAIRETGESDA